MSNTKIHRRIAMLGKREGGVSAVEFGLILPVLIILLLGMMDYGWIFYIQLNLTNAAREGARRGVVQDDFTTATSVAQSTAEGYLSSMVNITTANVDITNSDAGTGEVRVDIHLNNFKPLIGLVPTPDSLHARSVMRWELFDEEAVTTP
jgi:Flp pilus assembly protein TadG